MKKISIEDNEYEIIKDKGNIFNKEDILEKYTDYFTNYDYIVGDYSYDKLRLKGFYESNNKKVNKINDIKYLDEYIKNYCNYHAKYFVLKKVKKRLEK